jgi:hypothetical protein
VTAPAPARAARRLLDHRGVRSLLPLVFTIPASAAADPLADAELRIGYGVALAGRGEMTSARATPLTLAAIVAVRTTAQPPLAGYGGVVVETLDRTSVGATAGIRLAPEGGRWRLAAGGVAVVAPATLWGPSAAGGVCTHAASLLLCGDLQLTAFLGGSDLAEGQVVTHLQVVGAMVFDAF